MTLIPPNPIEKFLNIVLIDKGIFFINLWSVVHLIMGGVLAVALSKIFNDKEFVPLFVIFLVLIILYEFFEILLLGVMFRQEIFKDIVWDIIIGAVGFLIVYWGVIK